VFINLKVIIMKTRILLLVLLVTLSVSGYATKWVIASSGDSFTPSSITVNQGDTINFVLESHHNAKQVSLATWNANGTALMSGGFQTNFGGGMILASQLSSGANYYVCEPHASIGMKGTIVVQVTTGIAEDMIIPELLVYPNPSDGKFRLEYAGFQESGISNLEVYSIRGEKLYESAISGSIQEIDLGGMANGIYILKINDNQKLLTEKTIIKR
jgi:plastocyanin